MNCDWSVHLIEDGMQRLACVRCEYQIIAKAGFQVRRACDRAPKSRHPLECIYRGDQLGRTKLRITSRCGCGQAKDAAVFECEVHEYAAPLANGRLIDQAITDCRICGEYLNGS